MASVLGGGAAAIALMDWLGSKGQSLTITDNITTNMTISATTNSVTDCFQDVEGQQVITVDGTDGPIYEQKIPEACQICTDAIRGILTARTSLERDAQLANPAYNPQVANQSLITQMLTGSSGPLTPQSSVPALGPCTAMCHGIVVLGVSQSETFMATQSCSVMNSVTNDISQSIKGQISAYLKNQQDFIGQLESAFTSNTESIATNLSSTMSQSVTNNFVQDLHQTMSAVQSVDIKGNSILADNISQTFTGKMVGKLEVNNTVIDQLRQSASYSISQSLLNKNDTIGDLSKDFLQVIQTMSALLEELTSQILIIIAAVIAAVVLVVGALFVFNKSFHSWANNTMSTVADAEVSHFNMMQTDPEYRAQMNQEKIDERASRTQSTVDRKKAQQAVVREKANAKETAAAGRASRRQAGTASARDYLGFSARYAMPIRMLS